MKKIVILGLLSILASQNLAMSKELTYLNNEYLTDQNTDKLVNACPINSYNMNETVNNIKSAYNCLDGKELEAITLDKGRKFIVRSKQPMSSDSPVGTLIDFDSVGDIDIFTDKKSSKVMFTGEIIENKSPRLGGRSSTLKLSINKIRVDNITYPARAYISKMGKKQVFAGVLAGAPIYFLNLADVADKGTVTIDKIYKDPCQYSCESIKSPIRPFYYLGGAILQFADLLISPVVCFFLPGENIEIPENTAFEIKLENNISLLKI